MSTSTSRTALLEAAQNSAVAVGAHDRGGWVGLFGIDGSVEDPVGSQPHNGRYAIERFYDTFIGPREIVFRPHADLVVDNTVIRDVDLAVKMSDSVQMSIPTYIRYDLSKGAGDLKIARLQAYWELPAMVGQFVRSGLGAIPAGLGLSGALLRNQGVGGAAGFLTGLRTGGRRAKDHVVEVLMAAATGDELAVKRQLTEPAQITRGDDVRLSISELASLLIGAHVEKVIAAGRFVVARTVKGGEPGVVITELVPGRPVIRALRFYGE